MVFQCSSRLLQCVIYGSSSIITLGWRKIFTPKKAWQFWSSFSSISMDLCTSRSNTILNRDNSLKETRQLRHDNASCQFISFVSKIRRLFSPSLPTPQTCLPAIFSLVLKKCLLETIDNNNSSKVRRPFQKKFSRVALSNWSTAEKSAWMGEKRVH